MGTQVMTNSKTHFDYSNIQIVTKLKNSNCDKKSNSNCDKNSKCDYSKTQFVTKLKKNLDKSKTQIVTTNNSSISDGSNSEILYYKQLDTLTTDEMFSGQRFAICAMLSVGQSFVLDLCE